MTSVDEALELHGGMALHPSVQPRALRAVPDYVVASRPTSTLENRRRWERLYRTQLQVGKDGQLFRIVKLRSMRTDAESLLAELMEQNEGSGLLFKMKDDPRVTLIGRVLRKLSLDELPQFWNVLIGDMSIVRPRLRLPREVTDYEGKVFRRLYVKPGITGLRQVSGRSDLSWEESVQLDLHYVENWSVIGDLQIMWRTAKVMVQPSGAY